jgi:hypothetical protein
MLDSYVIVANSVHVPSCILVSATAGDDGASRIRSSQPDILILATVRSCLACVFWHDSEVDSKARVPAANSCLCAANFPWQRSQGITFFCSLCMNFSTWYIVGLQRDVQALLQVGFSQSEFQKIQDFMLEMDADMVTLYSADAAVLKKPLCDAFEGEPGFKDAPEGTPRAIIMSGMYTSEVRSSRCAVW